MSRALPPLLLAHLKQPATTVCSLLKIMPVRPGVETFGITTLDADLTYDDGAGPLEYRAKRGYTAFDLNTRADMGVDNSEASGLLAEFPSDGVTAEGVARGDYDSARFIQYLVNYEDLSMGHVILNSGQVGQVTMLDDLTCKIELRSLTQILKQVSLVEVTSITCRAKFGDERCKMPLVWSTTAVAAVGAESDRSFSINPATAPSAVDNYYVPGVVSWLTGANAGRENEVESYVASTGAITLAIPTYATIEPADTFRIRRDCKKSKAACIAYGNLLNMRAEPELPRADGTDLQSPTPK